MNIEDLKCCGPSKEFSKDKFEENIKYHFDSYSCDSDNEELKKAPKVFI